MQKNISGPAPQQDRTGQDSSSTGQQVNRDEKKNRDPVSLFTFLKSCGPVPVEERWNDEAYIRVAYWLLENGWEVNVKDGRTETLTEAVRYPLALWADVIQRLKRADDKEQRIFSRCAWIRGVAKKIYRSWADSVGYTQPKPSADNPEHAGVGAPDPVRPGDSPQRQGPSARGGPNGGSRGGSGGNGGQPLGGIFGTILSDIAERHGRGSVERTGAADRAADHSVRTAEFRKWRDQFQVTWPDEYQRIMEQINAGLAGVPYRDAKALFDVRMEERMRQLWLADVGEQNQDRLKNQSGGNGADGAKEMPESPAVRVDETTRASYKTGNDGAGVGPVQGSDGEAEGE